MPDLIVLVNLCSEMQCYEVCHQPHETLLS
jgi:hypothetical protein